MNGVQIPTVRELNNNVETNEQTKKMMNVKPLSEIDGKGEVRHSRSCSNSHGSDNKENANVNNVVFPKSLSLSNKIVKPSSLQLCMQINDSSNSSNIWDHSDSDAAPASSWSTLPNK